MQDTDQREQPPRRVKIDVDLAVEPFLENFAALIVQPRRAMSMVSICDGVECLMAW